MSAPSEIVPVLVSSAPGKLLGGVPESLITIEQRGVDPLAAARAVLHDRSALTFEQLSWPDDAQLRDEDGGVYRASAQLLVSALLELPDGQKNLRAMLRMLPQRYNWQIAFRGAFFADFPQPIDTEKWWALQTASFTASNLGSQWTPAVSRDKLGEILCVPVEMRSAPTNLPAYAAISLQAALQNFAYDRQVAILEAKLRDLEIAHWRMAPQFTALTDAYRRTLADYLNLGAGVAAASNSGLKHPRVESPKKIVADTVKKLDALDAQRRAVETAVQAKGPVVTPW